MTERPTADDEPARATRPAPLTAAERRTVAVAAIGPIIVAAAVLTPVGLWMDAGIADVVGAAIVYGGLLGLAGAFVAVDRLQSRQCPRCRTRNPRRTESCPRCGYDLQARPRYTCTERHGVFLDGGRCDCGRRLQALPTARGVWPEVRMILRIGGGLLAFLVAVGLVIQVLERTL
jgi:ribosomal protein L40E